ncbi:sugar phosphate/phosphate translocator [Scenedesmus sp. PABB004]|nr:sugar phosphate/phosphate translocator [Scenedesmus sp. PABB004]
MAAAPVDLAALRARLAALGVALDAPPTPGTPDAGGSPRADGGGAWEAQLQRKSSEVAALLARCSRVQHALAARTAACGDDGGGHDDGSSGGEASGGEGAAPPAPASRPPLRPAAARPRPLHGRPGTRSAGAPARLGAGVATPAAVAGGGSELLARAAQRLLRDAQADAQQAERALAVMPRAAGGRPAARGSTSDGGGGGGGGGEPRSSPLATVLAQYREAQAAWAADKAKLRREAAAATKRATKLELELAQLRRASEHKAHDVASLRAALKGRDALLSESQARVRTLEEALAKSQDIAAEKLCGLARERDDLQGLLLATLDRLEGVEGVVAAADASSAAMEDKVRVLEGERLAALRLAADAQADATAAQEEQGRLAWQRELLDRVSEVQLRHNQHRSAALKELLAAARHGRSGAGGSPARRSGSAAALRERLDELLGPDEGQADGGSASSWLGGAGAGAGGGPIAMGTERTRALVTAGVVAAWYTCNIGVLLLNKYLLSSTPFKCAARRGRRRGARRGRGAPAAVRAHARLQRAHTRGRARVCRAPVFLTLCHMVACAGLGYALSLAGVTPIKPVKSRRQMWKISLLASIFCVTIVLGNLSLKYIPVSFNQAIGATTPFFTAIFAVLMQGHKEAGLTYLTLVPIAGGVVIASGGEPLFNLLGFTACLLATSGRALKSVVQAMLLTDATEKLDPMSLLFYMSSFSVLLLLPTTLLLEPGVFAQVHGLIYSRPGFFWSLLFNSCIAYLVNLTNFLVTKYTSALTLQVLGNMKGVIAAGISIALFKNPVTAKGMLGYLITVCGVVAYSETKRRHKLRQIHDTGKTASMEDMAGLPLLKTSLSDAGGKDSMLGGHQHVTLHANAAIGHSHRSKLSNPGDAV